MTLGSSLDFPEFGLHTDAPWEVMGKLCKWTLDTPTLLKVDTQPAKTYWYLLSEQTPSPTLVPRMAFCWSPHS